MDEKKVISMSDISRMAGVSVATVSRVINQNGRYSEETEQRVRDIIEKYNYIPNMAAKGLKTRRSNFVGVIVPDITNEFFAQIVQELQNGLRKQGYMALVCNTGEDETVEREYMSILGAVNLSGLVFVSGNARTVESGLQNIPAIYIDRAPEVGNKDALVIESDNYDGARLAVKELCDKGCKRVACLNSSKIMSTYSLRYSGYRDQLALHGIEADESLLIKVDEISFQAAHKAMDERLRDGCSFDGLFCTTDWLAMGAMTALEENGLRIPEDVKVVGFDDISMSSLIAKPLTTIHQQTNILGRTAAEEILRLINGEPNRAQRVQIGVSLIRRQTT